MLESVLIRYFVLCYEFLSVLVSVLHCSFKIQQCQPVKYFKFFRSSTADSPGWEARIWSCSCCPRSELVSLLSFPALSYFNKTGPLSVILDATNSHLIITQWDLTLLWGVMKKRNRWGYFLVTREDANVLKLKECLGCSRIIWNASSPIWSCFPGAQSDWAEDDTDTCFGWQSVYVPSSIQFMG